MARCFGAFGVAVRRQPRRRLDEAGQHRGFRDRDVLGGLAEIALGGGLDAIGAGTEIDAVEVEFEQLRLGMLALQPQRQLHFLQLARHGAFLGQEQVLGELLGQGRAALRDAAMQDVGDRGAQDAEGIDAVMRIETAVLDGDERLRQIGRQVLQRNIGAGHFAARGQRAAVEADDLDGRRPLWNFQRLDRRQVRADIDHEADHRDRGPQAEHRSPVEQPADRETSARFRAPLAAAAAGACLAFARRFVVIFGLAFGFLRPVVARVGDAVFRRQAQVGKRGRKPEQGLLAPTALFPSQRHTRYAAHTGPAAR